MHIKLVAYPKGGKDTSTKKCVVLRHNCSVNINYTMKQTAH